MRLNIYIVLLSSLLLSCSLIEKTEFKTKSLARVNESVLTESDLKGLLPKGTSYEDSVKIIQEYIGQWVRRQLVLEKAIANVAMTEDLEKQVKSYREDLLIYTYENALVSSKVDTSISAQVLEEYYELLKSNFPLQELTLNVTCLVVNKGAPKIDSIHYWMRDPRGRYAQKIEEYSLQYAHFFSLDTNLWHSYSFLTNKLNPISIYEPERTLLTRRYFEREDSLNRYFLRVFDYKLKGAHAPLGLVRDRLKQTILTKRKTDYINNMYESLYKKAYKKNQFEIYKQANE